MFFVGQLLFSQEKDSLKVEKNIKFSILGGPGYTPDFGVVLGGSALFTFSTDVSDESLKRSVVPIAFAYMFSGGGSAVVRPQLFFNHDRFRIFGKVSFNSTYENYYGVGFKTNNSTERGEDITEYKNIGFKFNPIFYFKYKETDLFIGGSVDVASKQFKKPSDGVQKDPDYIAGGGTAEGLDYFNTGLGLNISYDTRDVPANAYKGVLLKMEATFYAESFGGTSDFSVYHFQYKQYKALDFIAERTVLAWMLDGRFTSGDVPLTDLSMVGSPFDLRGYYMGQYRDNNALMGLVEYRQMINAGDETRFRRILSRVGFATWVGLGSIDPDFKGMQELLPNFGAGLRIEVQPRMNFRVDVGRDPISGQTLVYFNMTEAF